uniref:Large ribosomal subunit protein bL32m n=1 Tax=Clastoptera arizonana TaxID=38151 RepID=A0A1B6CMP4_9HEMI
MINRVVFHIQRSMINFEKNVALMLGRRVPPDDFCFAITNEVNIGISENIKTTNLLKDFINDSILWAVPTHRRPIEKRWGRKFGWPTQVYKMLIPKQNLIICNDCGEHHEIGHLCANCYSKVAKETKEIQEVIQAQLGYEPVEKEVVVLYKGEKEGFLNETWEGKRIIEMPKERPNWFSQNLLQKSTTPPATTTDVKPTELA